MTMSLGTALSIMGLSLAVRYARERTVAWFGGGTSLSWVVPVVKIAGGVVLILFATDPVPDGDPHQRQRRLHRRRMLIKENPPAAGFFITR